MCQSLNDGGRRCDANPTTRALRAARKRGDQVTVSNILTAQTKYGKVVQPMELELPQDVQDMLNDLNEIGTPLLAGGVVRDARMGIVPKDFDIEVYGVSISDMKRHLKAKGYHVDSVGQSFGILKAKKGNGEDFDISVPRRESRQGVGHRGFDVDFDESMTPAEASQRRDFTFNAMMYDAQNSVLVDPHGGAVDLDNKILRHTSPAFAEDPLRPLRGFQFAGRYGFTMHADTVEMCRSLRGEYSSLAKERVRGEWEKFYLKSKYPSYALRMLHDIGWDDTVPGLETVNLEAVDKVQGKGTIIMGAVIAANMSDRDAKDFTHNTIIGDRVSNSAYLVSRIAHQESHDVEVLMQDSRRLQSKGCSLAQVIEVREALGLDVSAMSQKAEELGIMHEAPPVLLKGEHVLDHHKNLRPGPWLGRLLKDAERAQNRQEFKTHEEAVLWVEERINEY